MEDKEVQPKLVEKNPKLRVGGWNLRQNSEKVKMLTRVRTLTSNPQEKSRGR